MSSDSSQRQEEELPNPAQEPEEDVQVEIQKLLGEESNGDAKNKPVAKSSEQAPVSMAEVAFWVLSSVGSSVGIIIVLKVVLYTYNFTFVLTLTFCHFFTQFVCLEFAALAGLFPVKRIPFRDNFIVATCMVASVMFMNYSLRANSVGFYQVTKLACIPCMVFIETTRYGKVFSRKIKLTLCVVILGVAGAVVTDVEFNFMGAIYGCLAVLSTTQFQIWTGAKQKEYGLQGLQFQHSQAHAVTLIVGTLAIVFEIILPQPGDAVTEFDYAVPVSTLIFVSCLLAIAVNVTSASLIGKTSPVTYQVVGHAKTCLVLIGGFMLFPIVATGSELAKNICGIVTALVGVVLYGHLKHTEQTKSPDCCDAHCTPGCLHFMQGS